MLLYLFTHCSWYSRVQKKVVGAYQFISLFFFSCSHNENSLLCHTVTLSEQFNLSPIVTAALTGCLYISLMTQTTRLNTNWAYQTLFTPIMCTPALYIQWWEYRILLLIQTNCDWHFTWATWLNPLGTINTPCNN